MFVSEDKRIFEIIEDFIVECKNNYEDEFKLSVLQDIGKENFLKEYCTLKLSFPRRKGTTTLGLKLFDKYDSNICSIKRSYCDVIKYIIKVGSRDIDGKLFYEFENKEKVKDIVNISSQKFENDFKEIIIIDTYSYTKGDSLKRFYEVLSERENVKCIICLG